MARGLSTLTQKYTWDKDFLFVIFAANLFTLVCSFISGEWWLLFFVAASLVTTPLTARKKVVETRTGYPWN